MNPYDLFMSSSSISLLISPSLTLENLSDTSQFFGVSGQANNSVGIIYFKEGFKYIGNLNNGIINGFGVAYWPEKTYEGEWINNKREGKGIEKFTDGRIYDGEFKNDKREGYGEFFFGNGNIFKGMFLNGKQDGDGQIISNNGNIKRGIWKNGKRIKWIENSFNDSPINTKTERNTNKINVLLNTNTNTLA